MSLSAAFTAEDFPSMTIGQPMSDDEMIQQRNEQLLTTGTKPRPWSHTALDNFCTCPHQYHEVKVLKHYEDVQGDEAIWGNYVHKGFEDHLRDAVPLPENLATYQTYMDAIKRVPGTMYVEYEMCLNNKLQPCKAFDPGVFVRGYADVLHVDGAVARVMDHKTGKRKPGSRQMKLMALMVFHHFPEVMRVKVGFFWLKVDAKDTDEFTREQVPELWNEFLPDLQQFKRAFETDTWQKRSSGLCYGWCPVTSCEFWKPKRIKR
jgi:hypothetical protein